MVTLLLLLTILHGADGLFLQTRLTGNWTEAKLACSKAGGRLPLPGDDVTNSALAEHLLANDVNSAWIDVQSVETPWHINGAGIIYDQGCHSAGSLGDRIYYKAERWESCAPLCTHLEFHFVGYLRSGSSATCVCLNYTTPLGRLRDSECQGSYYNGFRVVTTSQSSYSVANLPWTARSGSRGGMYALTVTFLSGSNFDLRLEEDYCYKPHHALCCVQDTALTFPMYTWFDAHYKCSVLGGQIIAQGGLCGQSHTNPADNSTTRFWPGAHAWVWYINDTLSLEHRFTNWSQEQPSLESGSCVVVTREGALESASCGELRAVMCDTDAASAVPLTVAQTTATSGSPFTSTDSDPPNSPTEQIDTASYSVNAGVAAGSAIGSLVLLGVIVGAIVMVWKRRESVTETSTETNAA